VLIPASWSVTVDVEGLESVALDIAYERFEGSFVGVRAYEDTSGDGVRQQGEGPASGVSVCFFIGNTDDGECRDTNSDGVFWIGPEVNTSVRVSIGDTYDSVWIRSGPGPHYAAVDLGEGETVIVEFAVKRTE
ncbi:MAG: hypothetical protein ACE5FA_10775, partial [Dehalococcoidia bacterium]